MTLGELKQHFEGFAANTIFNFALSSPFSWRGSYNEVCFTIIKHASSKEENLDKINSALTDTFFGWKGGEFSYDENTTVNFEPARGSYTDGYYARELIAEIEGSKYFFDEETKLVNLAFS